MTKKQTKKDHQHSKKSEKKLDRHISDNTKLTLTLTWSEIKKQYDQILKEQAKEVKVKGFRQGKTPLQVAEQYLDREKLINHTLQVLVPSKYESLIKKEKKEPLTNPEIVPLSLDWGKDWELEVNIAEKPEVKVGHYQKAVKKGLEVAQREIEKHEAQQQATEKNEQGQDKDKQDQDKEDKEDKKDKKETKKKQTAAKKRQEQQHRQIKLQQIFKALVEAIEPKVPELLLKEETKHEIQHLAKQLEQMGLKLDDYLKRRQQTFEEMSSSIAAQTLGKLQLEFALSAIEDKEEIEISAEEEATELEKINQPNFKEQLAANPQYREYFLKQIKRRKLLDKFLELAK